MTYVSRKTRIIVSRWTDVCDADYSLKASRKRSDGRLKKYGSCDDLRAWVNDNCVKHDYLVDLMSNGEFVPQSPLRLYGRFVPVPILFKLLQNPEAKTAENKSEGDEKINEAKRKSVEEKEEENVKDEVQQEKKQLEKNLLNCTFLLNKAVEKLEKIGCIVEHANDEMENARNEEIQEAFEKSKLSCSCSENQSSSAISSSNNFPSKSQIRNSKDSIKYNELLRRLSCLKKKLEKINKYPSPIEKQIQANKEKTENLSSCQQITELFSRQEQERKKTLEKLLAERGKLLSEMCQISITLNSLKKASKSKMRKQMKRGVKPEGDFCSCGCKRPDTESDQIPCSDSSSAYNDMNRRCKKAKNFRGSYSRNSADFSTKTTAETDSDPYCDENYNSQDTTISSKPTLMSNKNDPSLSKKDGSSNYSKKKKNENDKLKEKKVKKVEKSKVKFTRENPCSKKFYADDLSAFESSLSEEQQNAILKVIKIIKENQMSRPSTSPTTKREKQEISKRRKSQEKFSKVCGRRVKSETTMKEIEKTLRNYEQRLSNVEFIECRVEELKEKSSEANRLKKMVEQVKSEAVKFRALDREKSNREITRLSAENWELKKMIEELTVRSEIQSKKIQNLKCSVMKARELECETKELKKELSKYQDAFENQRKCISKWESVVTMQRTEIENLMNHIKKLTMKEDMHCSSCHERRSVQKTRSFSPEKMMAVKMANSRAKTYSRGMRRSSDEDDGSYCCGECRMQESRRVYHPRAVGRGCCSPNENMEWCN